MICVRCGKDGQTKRPVTIKEDFRIDDNNYFVIMSVFPLEETDQICPDCTPYLLEVAATKVKEIFDENVET